MSPGTLIDKTTCFPFPESRWFFVFVEEASRLCVEGNACRYSYFKRCLKQLTERSQEKAQQKLPSHENLRGKEFYK